MATLTKLESKLGSEHAPLARKLEQSGKDARETQNEKAQNEELRKLTDWALPVQQRHLQEVLDGSLKLAAAEDPDEEE